MELTIFEPRLKLFKFGLWLTSSVNKYKIKIKIKPVSNREAISILIKIREKLCWILDNAFFINTILNKLRFLKVKYLVWKRIRTRPIIIYLEIMKLGRFLKIIEEKKKYFSYFYKFSSKSLNFKMGVGGNDL